MSKLAPIECLPPELIQPIFQLSDLNLCLADASPHIAAKLAHPHIFHDICSFYLLRRNISNQKLIQERIFSSKWMTWEFFKSFVLKSLSAKGCLCGKTPKEGCWEGPSRVWPPNFKTPTKMQFHKGHLSILANITCHVPLRLLRGPWTQDKTEFLRFIMWTTWMGVDFGDKQVQRLITDERRKAIMDRNLEVVQIFNHDLRLNKPVDLSILRFAVLEAGCDRSIVFDILSTTPQAAWSGAGWDRPSLYEWCLQEQGRKAKWLLTKLRELRGTAGHSSKRYGDLRTKSGDYDGGEDDRLVINEHYKKCEKLRPPIRDCTGDELYSASSLGKVFISCRHSTVHQLASSFQSRTYCNNSNLQNLFQGPREGPSEGPGQSGAEAPYLRFYLISVQRGHYGSRITSSRNDSRQDDSTATLNQRQNTNNTTSEDLEERTKFNFVENYDFIFDSLISFDIAELSDTTKWSTETRIDGSTELTLDPGESTTTGNFNTGTINQYSSLSNTTVFNLPGRPFDLDEFSLDSTIIPQSILSDTSVHTGLETAYDFPDHCSKYSNSSTSNGNFDPASTNSIKSFLSNRISSPTYDSSRDPDRRNNRPKKAIPRVSHSHKCPKCLFSCVDKLQLRRHLQSHKSLECTMPGCKKHFAGTRELRRHMNDIHRKSPPGTARCGREMRKDNIPRHQATCKLCLSLIAQQPESKENSKN